ncbi:hypothetical protein Tco_0973948 [Tanacetum coccineum]|uniref:Uncharacterized protein n=1 Tax=Tanacetum coccineum TaxID=301880 RepID=A0ABQ5EA78_9ASTR
MVIALRECILRGPYTPTIVTTPTVPGTEDSPAVPEQTTVETLMNISRNVGSHQKATTRSYATTRYKGKEIAKPTTPPSKSASEEDSDPEQAQKDKDMQKNLALIAKKGIWSIILRNAESQNGSKTLPDTDEEIDEQELEAHYSYMAKIQEVPNADSGTDAEPLEQVQYDTDDNVFANDIQHFDQSESISNTCAVETDDSNVTPDSPICGDNDSPG